MNLNNKHNHNNEHNKQPTQKEEKNIQALKRNYKRSKELFLEEQERFFIENYESYEHELHNNS